MSDNLFSLAKRILINKIGNIKGKKILILDSITNHILSIIYTKEELRDYDFINIVDINDLMDYNAKNLDKISYKLIYLLDSKQENVNMIKINLTVLDKNRFDIDNYIYFTDYKKQEFIKLTSILCYNFVKVIDEIEINFYITHYYAFHFNKENNYLKKVDRYDISNYLSNLMANLSNFPDILYDKNSIDTLELGKMIHDRVSFSNFQPNNSKNLLIILDRKKDTITPLITSWKYFPLIHNILNIEKNKIENNIILNINNDDFLNKKSFDSYPDICNAIAENTNVLLAKKKNILINSDYIKELSIKNDSFDDPNTITDIKDLSSDIIIYRKLLKNIDKHSNILQKINMHIQKNHLFDIYNLQQKFITSIITSSDDYNKLISFIENSSIEDHYKVILFILYSVKKNNIDGIILHNLFNNITNKSLINLIFNYFNYSQIKTTKLTFKYISNLFSNITQSLTYQPLLKNTINDIFNNNIKPNFCLFNTPKFNISNYHTLVIYIIGGITYDEIAVIHEFNQKNSKKIYLGGDLVLNSKKFLDLLDYNSYF